ncbi:MAG: dephospho-CoA kinase [Verrucomicrobia bacterium]|nr:dephospho-CoA kinase [Verrucomicrobiota bacterium]
MIHVGLTGGLCTGKSTVAAMFAELGAPVIDADAVVHELLAADPEVRRRVVETFGTEVTDAGGAIDRAKLARVAFGAREQIARLTGILYPAVRARVGRWFAEQKAQGAPAAIAEVAMLCEGGATQSYDVIIVVTAERATQLERFIKRGGTADDFSARLAHQWPLEQKEQKADYIINNNGPREVTRKQVAHLWAALQEGQAGADAGKEEV